MLACRTRSYDALDPVPMLGTRPDACPEEQFQSISDLQEGISDLCPPYGFGRVSCCHQAWLGDDYRLVHGSMRGVDQTRDRRRHRFPDILIIEATVSGFRRDVRTNTIFRNNLSIYTSNEDFHTRSEVDLFRDLYLPFEIVGYDPSRHRQEYSFSLDSAVGHLINAALADVLSCLPHAPSRDVPAMIEQVSNLVRDLVLSSRKNVNPSSVARARRLAMDAYIEKDIHRSDLSAARLAHDFAISRATLYRTFDADGGVEAYIRRRRLHRAFISLKQAAPKRGEIRRISERYGFLDAANFNRAFRQEFGVKPSDILELHETEYLPPHSHRAIADSY